MKERIKTGAVLAVSMTVWMLCSYHSWVRIAGIILMNVLAVTELDRALGFDKKEKWIYAVSLVMAVVYPLLNLHRLAYLFSLFFIVFDMLAAYIVFFARTALVERTDRYFALLTGFLIVSSFSSLSILYERNVYYFVLPFVLSALSDVAAYLAGRSIGSHHFTQISPKKTLEGCLAGVLVPGVLILVLALCFHKTEHLPLLVSYAMTASIISELGDLYFSFIKRGVQLKDFGSMLPGHGGFLDRFDSAVFTIGYTCAFLLFFGHFL